MKPYAFAFAIVLLGVSAAMVPAAPVAVSEQEAHDWLLNVIPLPQDAQIGQKLTARASRVSVMLWGEEQPLLMSFAMQIGADAREKFGVTGPPLPPGDADLTILCGIPAADGTFQGRLIGGLDRIKAAKNSDQAYTIQQADDKTIIVAGLTPQGVYYGMRTLWQLVAPTARQEDGQWVLDVPLGEIVDWPDLAERGEWGGSVDRDIEWMARYKMNLCESHCRGLTVTPEGKGVADFDKTLIERGAACAVKVIPIITHLDQLEKTGLFEVFPDTLGEGDPTTWPYGGTTVKPACFSDPQTARVLADWMVSLAEQPEITDINVWLSEHHVTCACETCKAKGQFALEAEAVARGFELARDARPDIKLRVLLTQGSYAFNDQVIAALPREIGITYYDGGKTYDSSRNEMIYPLLEDYAKSGGWLGCYPQLTASWRIVCPWSGPQFIRFRMNEFVDDGLECLCGYATPDNRFYEFNVLAAAEWSWNAKGRDEREFALAYFTQKGVADPEKAADWAVMLGPVGWDVYGGRVPYNWFFGGMAQTVKSGNVPEFGAGPFTYMPDAAHLAENMAVCKTALALAEDVGDAAMIAETRTIEGYLKMLQTIREIGVGIGKKKELSAEEKTAAAVLLARLDEATRQTMGSLRAWQQAVAPDAEGSRFEDTVRVTEETGTAICEFVAGLGVNDPGRPYRMRKAGEWKTDDFPEGPEITKTWDVTDFITEPGTYRVRFVYESGWYGLHIFKAALMSARKGAQGEETLVAVDEHEGTAAYRNKDHEYEFTVAEVDADRAYSLVADIRGMPRESPADKQGCNGKLLIWKVRPE